MSRHASLTKLAAADPAALAELRRANEELAARRHEAQDTLEAIRTGTVDAFVVRTPDGERVYALQTADEPYRLMVEQMQQGAASLTGDGVVLYANPPLVRLTGGSPQGGVLGARFDTLFVPEECKAVRDLVEAGSTRPVSIEARLRGADGREIPVYVSASPLHTDVAVVCVLLTDLAEKKRIEALEATEKMFRILGDSSPVPIWVTDRHGSPLFINRAFCDFFGVTLESARSGWPPLLHPDDAQGYIAAFRRALETGTEFRAEARARTADGRWRWIASYGAPWRSESGELLGSVGSSPDITDLKHAEAALRHSEERFRLATEALQGVVYDFDIPADRITRSSGLRDQIGYEPSEVTPTFEWFVQQIHPEDRGRMQAEYAAATEAHATALEIEYRIRHKDGRYIWVWDHGRLLYDAQGRPLRLIGSVISIDTRKQLEEALKRADQQKDLFLATLAHELRNPLAPIRNAVAILKVKGPPVPELQWSQELIDRQVGHMARLLDDLLDVSRITQNKLQLRKERLELRSFVESAVETTRPLIEERGHTLTVTLPPEPVYLEADAVRLSQMLSNLLNNAAKYTDPGGAIALSAERREDELVVSVKDTGIGIRGEALGKIFQMFSQEASAVDRSEGGLGIGLSLVRGLVELHGGMIEARSEGLGRGSEFVVTLPTVPSAGLTPSGSGSHKKIVAPTPRLRVLIADDNKDTAETLAMVLSLQGYDVRTAFDGEEALAVADAFRPHVALLDIGMPKANGHIVARRIRERPWGERVVLVAQTGWGQEEDQRRTQEAGFDHHMVKPVPPSAVTELLQSLHVPGDEV